LIELLATSQKGTQLMHIFRFLHVYK
jgi:hypothetical protein